MFVSDNADALCGCGNIGDVEGLVAGNAIARRHGMDAARVMDGAGTGDPACMAVVADLCRVLGRALYNLVATLDLQRISLGGSVFWHHRDLLLPLLQAQIDGHLPALTADCATVAHVVARFLALLDLYRERIVLFEQLTPLGDLTVRWAGDDG